MDEQVIDIKEKKITLWHIISFVFFIGIFFIPFNSFTGLSFLGEFKNEAPAYILPIAFVFLAIQVLFTKKFYIPFNNLLFKLWLLVLLWMVVATAINYDQVSHYYFKGIGGRERFLRQFIALLISGIFFFLLYYNVLRRYSPLQIFYKLRKVFLFSFIVVSVYGLLEIAILKFGIGQLTKYLDLFDYFPFTSVYLEHGSKRISSVTFETPALATYLFMVAGWMFSYMITEKKWYKFIPGFLVILLAMFSDSRAGLAIIFLQFFIFLLLLIRKRKHHKLLIKIAAVGIIGVVLIGVVKGKEITEYVIEKATSFDTNDEDHSISNKSRFGLQYANFLVFKDYPWTGVGYGQQSYEAKQHYPRWATTNNWEFRVLYLNPRESSFPPGYNIFTRLLAETGIIGVLLFLVFLFAILYVCFEILRKNDDRYLLCLIILLSMIGVYMNWLKTDTFRSFSFWIHFAILIVISNRSLIIIKNDERK